MSHLQRIFLAAIVMALFGVNRAMATEEAKYTVIQNEAPFELRKYEPQMIAETLVEGDFEEAGNEAFSRLFDYISGSNKSRQNVEMTSPVGQSATSQKIDMTAPVSQKEQNGQWAISFMMPASFTLETLPEPEDTNITLHEIPERHVAAIRYSGLWSETNYLKNKEKLDEWINKNELNIVGEPIWARYNSPFTPWFMRRNEILIPVRDPAQEK